jgi:DMSO/TMAO reductase YedYZ molybdopterin-dependent catalytic subunit
VQVERTVERRGERRRAGSAAALAGAAAALVAAALATTVRPRIPFPVIAVAERVATTTPGGIATFFIELLQHLALPLTVLLTALALLGVTWALGRWLLVPFADRLGALPAAILAALPLWIVAVSAFEPDATTVSRAAFAVALGACALFGAAVTARVWRRLTADPPLADPEDASRRTAVRAVVVGGGAFALGWLQLGRVLFPRPNPGRLPLAATPSVTVPPPAPSPAFDAIPGLAPRVTANPDFYVVDEEIVDPDIDPATWTLSIGGLVERPYTLTYDQLLAKPLVEQYATLECISNEIGGDLISNGRWTGARLADLLEPAGIGAGAVEVVFRAVGGYSDSLPLGDALRPVTLIAVGLNGSTLPREHGFPARVLAPGYYGMKQPKWLLSIEVVDQPYTGYWERRGWIKDAVVRTMSRADTEDESSPTWVIAGVAFAGDRGISKVEVSFDDGVAWQPAELEAQLSDLTWRRWKLVVTPNGADHALVRAVDGDGQPQIAQESPPHPSGATGYMRVNLG